MLDFELTPLKKKPTLQLCSPSNREAIANLTSAYEIKREIEHGNIGKLTFNMPFRKVSRFGFKRKRNKQADKILPRYIIKYDCNNETEYYVIDKITDEMKGDKEYRTISCYSLGFELSYRTVRDYEVTSENLSSILSDLLADTNWSVGYVNASFDTKYRSFDASSTILDAIQSVAETFVALIVWDTKNRQINFYNEEDYGSYQGKNIAYGNLMESVSQEKNSDDFCTRLYLYGSDGMSIQDVNPTGQPYIEDYSYFLYPFQRDSSGNITNHSDYMSDDLCNALLDYQELLESKQTEFAILLESLETYQAELVVKQGELTDLNSELVIFEDNISVCNATNQSVGGQTLTYWIGQRDSKEMEISAKQAEIDSVQVSIDSITSNIKTLSEALDVSNNFTASEITEWRNFIKEKTYENSDIIDSKDLLETGKIEIAKINTPKFIVSTSILNILGNVENRSAWQTISMGEIVRVYHERLDINIEAKVLGAVFNFENDSINLTIGNAKEILSDEEKLIKSLYKTMSSSSTVDRSAYGWEEALTGVNAVQQLLNETWDATAREISASNNETVTIDRKGIRLTDIEDPLKVVVLQHGVIGLSNDGGDTWKTAISASGIVAERIIGTLIAGSNLTITTDNGDFLVNNNGVTIKDLDLEVIRSDVKSRIILSPDTGFKIQSNSGTTASPSWTDRLLMDTDGNLTMTGNFQTGSGSSVFKSDSNGIYLGSSTFSSAPFRVTLSGACTTSNLTVTGGSFSIGSGFSVNSSGVLTATGANITGTINATSGTFSGSISASTISGSTIQGNTITGGTITGSSISGGSISGVLLSGSVISGATISGGEINVDTDITVGNNIYLGNIGTLATKVIYFTETERIETSNAASFLRLRAETGVILSPTGYISYTSDSNRITTYGEVSGYIADLQAQITALEAQLATKSDIGHTHTYVVPSHNHGTSVNYSYTGTTGGSTN